MNEIDALTNDELLAKIREYEVDIRKNKARITRW